MAIKKTAKKSSSSSSSNKSYSAGRVRSAENKADMKKPYRYANWYESPNTGESMYLGGKSSEKAAKDARKRAAKVGKPVGKTLMGGGTPKPRQTRKEVSMTTVKSSRGNLYNVLEAKTNRRFRPDSRETWTEPVSKPKRVRGSAKASSVRATQGRAIQKARASVKKKAY